MLVGIRVPAKHRQGKYSYQAALAAGLQKLDMTWRPWRGAASCKHGRSRAMMQQSTVCSAAPEECLPLRQAAKKQYGSNAWAQAVVQEHPIIPLQCSLTPEGIPRLPPDKAPLHCKGWCSPNPERQPQVATGQGAQREAVAEDKCVLPQQRVGHCTQGAVHHLLRSLGIGEVLKAGQGRCVVKSAEQEGQLCQTAGRTGLGGCSWGCRGPRQRSYGEAAGQGCEGFKQLKRASATPCRSLSIAMCTRYKTE